MHLLPQWQIHTINLAADILCDKKTQYNILGAKNGKIMWFTK